MTDPGAGGLRTYALGHRILDAVRMAALDLGVVLPDKQVVSHGEVAHDCEMVAVTALRLMTGMPNAGGLAGAVTMSAGCNPAWSGVFSVEIVRCAPELWGDNGGVVPANAINDAFMPISKDAEVLLGTVGNIASNPYNFGELTANIQFQPPSGNFVVTLLQLTATMA